MVRAGHYHFLGLPLGWWLAITLGTFLLGGAVATVGPFGEASAAWVQAIGAIVALAITVSQSARLARIERERLAAPLEICIRGAQRALLHYDAFSRPDGRDLQSWAKSWLATSASEASDILQEVSLGDMPTGATVEALIEARSNAVFLRARVQAAADGKAGWNEGDVTTRARMLLCWKAFQDERDRLVRPSYQRQGRSVVERPA